MTLGTQIIRLSCRRLRQGVIGLCYHAVCEPSPAHLNEILHCRTPAQFEQDMAFIQTCGRVLTYEELLAVTTGSLKPDIPAFHVSFDDGYRECFDVVLPVLRRYEVPATFFIPTDFIDNRRMFYRNAVAVLLTALQDAPASTVASAIDHVQHAYAPGVHSSAQLRRWLGGIHNPMHPVLEHLPALLDVDLNAYLREHQPYLTTTQLRSMAHEGFTIGSHGTDHSRMQLQSLHDQREQMVTSTRLICDLVAARSVPFAIPFGCDGSALRRLLAIAQRLEELDLVFNCTGMRDLPVGIINRVGADSRRTRSARYSSVPGTVLRAMLSATLSSRVT